MLASPSTPSGGRPGITVQQLQDTGLYVFQKKYDGVRAQLSWDAQSRRARLVSRHGVDLSEQFPDVLTPVYAWAQSGKIHHSFVLDGELMAKGTKTLADLLRRVQSGAAASWRLVNSIPTEFVAFDVLEFLGQDYVRDRSALSVRLAALKLSALRHGPFVIAHSTGDGLAQLEYQRQAKGEGIVAKRKDSRYTPGVRSWSWVKFKITYTVRAICYGPSGESGHGSLLAMIDSGQVRDVGSVGSGMRESDRVTLGQVWARGEYRVALIDCLGVSKAGRLRQPVFKGFVDEPITSCGFEQQEELPVST